MRLADEIDEATFAAKNTEMRDRIARLELELEPAVNDGAKKWRCSGESV